MIYFIARDTSGNVRLRSDSLAKLQNEINSFEETPITQDSSKTKQRVSKTELTQAKKEAVKQVLDEIRHPKKAFDNKLRAELAKRAEQKLKAQVQSRKAALAKEKK